MKLSRIVDKHADRQSLVGRENMKTSVLHHAPAIYHTLLNSIAKNSYARKESDLINMEITIFQVLFIWCQHILNVIISPIYIMF